MGRKRASAAKRTAPPRSVAGGPLGLGLGLLLAQGTGTLTWVWDSGLKTSESTGFLRDGKKNGRWVFHRADGTVWFEATCVNGKRQ